VTVATEVENATQLALLRRIGCDRAQGPFLGMALTADEIDLLVSSGDDPQLPEVTPSPAHAVSGLPRLQAYGRA
jgi:hypothetical protein